MKPELEELLLQSGVKGMKWGKHKANVSAGVKKAGEKTKEVATKATSKVKPHIDSIKREHSWKKTLKNADKMSTKEIQKLSSRAQLENDLKRLSKKKKLGSTKDIGTSKDKKDYLNRANMSDQELHRKVQRLRVKSSLNRNANDATTKQKEIAKKVLHIAAPLVLQYALTKSIGKRDVVSAATNAALNLGGPKAKLIKNLVDQAKNVKKVKHSDELDDVILHLLEDEETLLHFGVKGMHWGVRKKVSKMVKNHRAKRNKRVLDAHEKLNKKNKTYKKLYAHNSKRYKTHLGAARKSLVQLNQINKQRIGLAITAASLAAPHVLPHVAKGASILGKAAQNPDNIRKAKNVAQALKRSPIRYVDGKMMKNVIN